MLWDEKQESGVRSQESEARRKVQRHKGTEKKSVIPALVAFGAAIGG